MYEMDQNEFDGSGLEEENQRLKEEIKSLKEEVQRYKLLADTFEKKYIDSQIVKKKNEITHHRSGPVRGTRTSDTVGAGNLVDSAEAEEVVKRLFVGGLSPVTTTESLREYFSQYGDIVDVKVMKDPNTQKSRGFGFVKFTDVSGVDAAQAARPHTIDNKVVDTKRAVTRAESSDMQASMVGKINRIFIGGLKLSTTEATLREYFSQFGDIKQVNTFEDKKTKMMKGFAYVTFEDFDTVDKVCQQRFHVIDERRVEVKRAQSKADSYNNRIPPSDLAVGGPSPFSMFESMLTGFAPAGGAMNPPMWFPGVGGAGGSAAPGGFGGGFGGGQKGQGAGWNSTGGGIWNSAGYNHGQANADSKTGSIGPMRGGGRFSERSSGPYGNNFGAYGAN